MFLQSPPTTHANRTAIANLITFKDKSKLCSLILLNFNEKIIITRKTLFPREVLPHLLNYRDGKYFPCGEIWSTLTENISFQ